MASTRTNTAKAKPSAARRGAAASETEARASYHHGDLPRALRAATLEILIEVGVEAFTLREAARRAGVNHRAVYRHFTDKRALLADVASEGYRLLAAQMRAAIAARNAERAEERLVALCDGYLQFARREAARYQVMFGPRLNADGRFPELEEAVQEALLVLREELRNVGPEATSIERRDAGISLWAAVHGLSSLVLAGRVPLSERKQSDYVDTLMRPLAIGVVAALAARA